MAQKLFKIRLSSFGSLVGFWNSTAPPASVLHCNATQWAASMVGGGNTYTDPGPGTFTATFLVREIVLFGGNSWDGTYADINVLPIAGMLPYGITLRASIYDPYFTPPAGNTIGLDWDSGPLTTSDIHGGGYYDDAYIATPSAQYPSVGFPSLVNLCFESIKMIFTLTAGEVGITNDFYIIGAYYIISWSWQINNGVNFDIPSTPIDGKYFAPGARFEVQSGDGDVNNIYSNANPSGTGVDLLGTLGAGSGSGVSSIDFSWIDAVGIGHTVQVLPADFEDWTWYFFWFELPASLPTGTLINVAVRSTGFPAIPLASGGTGTTFGGSVPLGVIKILGTEASGIYKLVTDKINDTIYVNSPVDNTTADFALPDPSAKTGFIGG